MSFKILCDGKYKTTDLILVKIGSRSHQMCWYKIKGGVYRAAQIVYRVLCMYVESDEIKIKCLQHSRLFLFKAP